MYFMNKSSVFKLTHFLLMSPCRWSGSSLASACFCSLPPPSSSWPLPSSSAASASAAKAMTTRCQPKHANRRRERRATSRMGHPIFSFFTPFIRSLPPTSFERFHIFWAENVHQPPGRFGIHHSAWERGMAGKATLHLGLKRGAGLKGRGGQTWTMGRRVHETLVGLGTWRKSGLCQPVLNRGLTMVWYCGESLRTKERSKWRNAFLLYGTVSCRSHLFRKNFNFIALFCRFVVCNKSFFFLPPHRHHTWCSSTDSVRSIRVTPRMFGVHSICTQSGIPTSSSRLR